MPTQLAKVQTAVAGVVTCLQSRHPVRADVAFTTKQYVLAAAGARVVKWQLSQGLGADRQLGVGMMCL
jgi:hypothetical protein